MKLLSKVICLETIKSSPTPPKSLRKHILSSIDQTMLPIYIPVVYFHPSNLIIPYSNKSKQLKKFVWEVLSRFYPLASTLVGNHYVDRNDAGVPFFKAKSNCHLSHVVPNLNQNHEIMEKFLPNSEVGDRHDLKAKGADPYDLKQQENVLAESRMMVPDCRKRLEAALSDLKGTLVEVEESGQKDGPEIDDARSTVANVEQIFQSSDA